VFRTIRWRESMSKLINMKEIKKHWLEVMELDAWRDRCMISFGTWKLTLASWYQVSVHSLLYRPCPVLEFPVFMRFSIWTDTCKPANIRNLYILCCSEATYTFQAPSFPSKVFKKWEDSRQGEGSLIKVYLERFAVVFSSLLY